MTSAHLNTIRKGNVPAHPRRLVYLGGIYDLINQDSSLRDHSFQFVAPILPSVRPRDDGYEIIVPTLTGDITHKDLLQALLPESKPVSYFSEMARQIFDYDAVRDATVDEKYAHYKAMADTTSIIGYCYGSFAAQQVMDAFEKHMDEEGLSKAQIKDVSSRLKAVHIAPITPVTGASPATQMYFLQLSDTVAATYMDQDIIRRAVSSSKGVEYMNKQSSDAIAHFDPQGNPNARYHEADKPLSVHRVSNALMVTSVTAGHGVGYYQMDDAAHAQEKQYHPNSHGIRGYVLSNRRLPEQAAVTAAQNNFSVMLPPLIKALVSHPEKLADIDTAQANFFSEDKLKSASKSLLTAKKLSEHVERNYTLDPHARG